MTATLYQMKDSGNCYKIRLLMSHLGRPLETVEVDITRGESRTSEFLQRNPNGKVPTLEIETGQYLAESNAILWYLGRDSDLWPKNPFDQALVMQWFGFEQYSHEPNIATCRYWIKILKAADQYAADIAKKQVAGYAALDVMEQHLKKKLFFVDQYSIADIALFAYTHVCHEGGFDLANYPAVRTWIDRVQAQPGFISIDE